ncbi:MAG: hypothetical protein H0W25_15865, partial [Acidimicrobiia bacterium]|nr:hypothetical protein [Acidimicrobiia bacterium]
MAADECHEVVRRAGIRQGAVTFFAHLDGAIFVFVYSSLLLPDIADDDRRQEVSFLVESLAFVAFLLVSGAWMGWRFYRFYRRRTDWLGDGEEPTVERVDRVLRLPFDLAAQGLVPWLVASVAFAGLGLALGEPFAEGVRTSTTIVLGGLVSCALAFLLTERMLRPVFALALGGASPERSRTLGVRPRLLLSWALGSGIPLVGLAVLPLKAEGEGVGPAVVGLALGALVVGLLATVLAARSVGDPLDEV